MELHILGSNKKTVQLSDDVFACKFNESLVHQVVTAYMAGGRAGTQSQKTRSEVRGGGAKPFKQKGSGRARCGSIRSPLWRTGGVIFAAKPRSYQQKVNKKMHKGAIRSIMSELIRSERLAIVEKIEVTTPRTKDFIKVLEQLTTEKKVLLVLTDVSEDLYLASRNLQSVDVRDVAALDPVALVGADKVIFTVDAMKQYEEMLK